MENIKIQQLIVLVAIVVSLVGTLLFLNKINEDAVRITGATADIHEVHEEVSAEEQEEGTAVRIVSMNITNESEYW